ncbi:heavy metal-binding domain-containing protein [Emticicia sp.]|uniref:heavy metal-binding domain-containing protein n=1 Tax=Emticicia sp. TaxID=1930953 RepID=UPI0037511F67
MEYKNCPNCNEKITNGFFNANTIYSFNDVEMTFVKRFFGRNSEAFCESCKDNVLIQSKEKYRSEIREVMKVRKEHFVNIPTANIPSPQGWEYEVKGMVTGQCTMGTGLLSELSSDWNDLLGQESITMNKKVLKGEENCLNILKAKALDLGGNAIVGIDIDYAEVGSLRGMILICMTGTAIKVNNTSIFDGNIQKSLLELDKSVAKMSILNTYSKNIN